MNDKKLHNIAHFFYNLHENGQMIAEISSARKIISVGADTIRPQNIFHRDEPCSPVKMREDDIFPYDIKVQQLPLQVRGAVIGFYIRYLVLRTIL